ncbi:MAG: Stk1 family PASTA domain-containing Ser/Thr kinase [Clostridia bacterium]|nr:Stk1 family PASTA domain-containing Ser/Thr kinase [Clostridia bacterium]
MIGALLDNRYELIEKVGTGGMADVYRAKCTLLNRYVAIKILKEEYKNDEEFVKRFNVESQAAAGLSHNNIVSVFDVGTKGELHYIVMEYVEGITLKSYLKENGPLPWEKAVDFATQIASALQHAHRKGIVHRDIKPQNILVTKDETLKVTDFGIARAVSSFTMKVDDNSMGTAHYCSPEQARGGYTDAKSDIYSLGVVMYEMVTGKLPFEGDSSVTVALKHIQEEATLPTEIVPDLPVAIEEIILKAMKKEQAERFANISDLLIELSIVARDKNYVPSKSRDNAAETRIIPSGEVKKAIGDQTGTPLPEKPVNKNKIKTEKEKKEDKVAVIAALGASFVFVAVVSLLVISMMFPSILPWNRVTTELEVPNLIGYNLEKAMEDYPDFDIRKDGEEFSTEHDEGVIISQTPDASTNLKSPYTVKVVVSKGNETVKVPYVKNLEYRQAIIELEEKNILYTIQYETSLEIPENVVMEVSPGEGTTIKAHKDIVILKVSSGNTQSFIVPELIGKYVDEAKVLLSDSGFSVAVVEKKSSKEKGTVIEQSVAGGSQLVETTTITITVSAGDSSDEPSKPSHSDDDRTDPPADNGDKEDDKPSSTTKPVTPDPDEETGSWF